MPDVKQNADGSLSVVREQDTFEAARIGGYMGPAGSNTPSYPNGGYLSFNIAGGTDTAAGILSWQNNLAEDIIIDSFIVDIQTASSNGSSNTITFGVTTVSSTTTATNLFTSHVTTNTGQFANSAPVAVKCIQNAWITGGTVAGTSGVLAGRVLVGYVQSHPTIGNK